MSGEIWDVTLIDDERGIYRLEIALGKVFLHLELRQWGPSIVRAIREELANTKRFLAERGILLMFVLIDEGGPKLYKFGCMFGFEEIARGNGRILMQQSTLE